MAPLTKLKLNLQKKNEKVFNNVNAMIRTKT